MVSNKEPRIEWVDLVAGMTIYFGLLLFLVGLHLTSINTVGNTSVLLTTLFTIFSTLYGILVIFGFVGVVIQFLRWLTWAVKTPTWKKKQGGNLK